MSGNFIITKHATERFAERSGDGLKNSDETIKKFVAKSFEAEMDPVFKVRAIINSGFQDARYRYWDGWIFVVQGVHITSVFRGKIKKGRILPLIHNTY